MLQTRIALDVMGGDRAPDAVLRGALVACSPLGKLRMAPERILLVGDEKVIHDRLIDLGGDPGFGIQHASQVIGMGESPATALRAKPDSSIAVMMGAVKKSQAGAAVGMGNTGAMVGAATLGLGTLSGVRRPGIAVTIDLTGHPLTIIDMGANVAPKPEHLYQNGMMGSVYMRNCLGKAVPRVGLLNIGEEEGKGTDLHKEAFTLLKGSPLAFVGNLEGNDLFYDKADVVVVDGFTGNVVLKLMEGFAGFMLATTMKELARQGITGAAEALSSVRRSVDYAEYGGALLLGVSGVVIIGHGRSDENAVANAIGLAARALDSNVNEHIVRGLAQAQERATT
ncbi:MAG: phosphate acyltransferase PlsX [Planctomycetota bacterium]